eukprot:COSAG01_NODE_3688_length_5795_cov_2.922577_2_plen_140_part_00
MRLGGELASIGVSARNRTMAGGDIKGSAMLSYQERATRRLVTMGAAIGICSVAFTALMVWVISSLPQTSLSSSAVIIVMVFVGIGVGAVVGIGCSTRLVKSPEGSGHFGRALHLKNGPDRLSRLLPWHVSKSTCAVTQR